MNWYKGKKVFITGGSSGIGKSMALLAAGYGADVAIVARGQARLDETLAELNKIGKGKYFAYSLDISDEEQVKKITKLALQDLGGLDVLVNNAGVAEPGYVQELKTDVFDAMMNINYFGTVHITRAFLPFLTEQQSGHICNVSSVVGFMGVYGYTAYGASKFAVTGFSECLRQELLEHNIEVSVVYPPDTDTPQWHAENEVKPGETKMLSGTIKVMQPEEVAQIMLSGIASGKKHIVPGFKSKLIYWANQHIPSIVRLFIDSDLKKYARQSSKR